MLSLALKIIPDNKSLASIKDIQIVWKKMKKIKKIFLHFHFPLFSFFPYCFSLRISEMFLLAVINHGSICFIVMKTDSLSLQPQFFFFFFLCIVPLRLFVVPLGLFDAPSRKFLVSFADSPYPQNSFTLRTTPY